MRQWVVSYPNTPERGTVMTNLARILGDAGFPLDPEESKFRADFHVHGENTVYWVDEDGYIRVGSYRDWSLTGS
jgi:hypothetical protein